MIFQEWFSVLFRINMYVSQKHFSEGFSQIVHNFRLYYKDLIFVVLNYMFFKLLKTVTKFLLKHFNYDSNSWINCSNVVETCRLQRPVQSYFHRFHPLLHVFYYGVYYRNLSQDII